MESETTPARQREVGEGAPGAAARGELAGIVSEREPIGAKITTEDILRALGREIEPDGVEPGGSAAADSVAWPHDESSDAHPAPAVLPPRVELNGACGDVLRALGLTDQLDQRRNSGTTQIDWGDEQPDPVWLDLYAQGLVHPPYRGPNADAVADVLDQRKPVRFKGNTEDILRALGRL